MNQEIKAGDAPWTFGIGNPAPYPDIIDTITIVNVVINYFLLIVFFLLLIYLGYNLYSLLKNKKNPITKDNKAVIESTRKRYKKRVVISAIVLLMISASAIFLSTNPFIKTEKIPENNQRIEEMRAAAKGTPFISFNETDAKALEEELRKIDNSPIRLVHKISEGKAELLTTKQRYWAEKTNSVWKIEKAGLIIVN